MDELRSSEDITGSLCLKRCERSEYLERQRRGLLSPTSEGICLTCSKYSFNRRWKKYKNPFFVLDEVYEADQTRDKKVIAETVYFSSQQEQNDKDEEIFVPQINSADYLKSLSLDEVKAELRRREIENE